jgi:protein-tyrosine phosphatase
VSAPTAESYWVRAGALLAGKYPASTDESDARRKVEALCAAGVRAFVDLTEDGELFPYSHLLPAGVRHERTPIVDLSCTTAERMAATLDVIDGELAHGAVYVHCRGGCGRTATVAGCWLVRHGRDPEAALALVEQAAWTMRETRCPETVEQRAMVLGWPEGG